MKVIVKAGKARINGAEIAIDSDREVQIAAADPSYPRKDWIVLKSDGTLEDLTGTPAFPEPSGATGIYTYSPAPPDLPDGCIPLAEIWVPAGATEIVADDITDRRILLKFGRIATYKEADTQKTVTETDWALKGRVEPGSSFLGMVPLAIHYDLNNPSGSGVALDTTIQLVFKSGQKEEVQNITIPEGEAFTQKITTEELAEHFISGDEVNAVELYARCSSTPTSGSEPSVWLKLVGGFEYAI